MKLRDGGDALASVPSTTYHRSYALSREITSDMLEYCYHVLELENGGVKPSLEPSTDPECSNFDRALACSRSDLSSQMSYLICVVFCPKWKRYLYKPFSGSAQGLKEWLRQGNIINGSGLDASIPLTSSCLDGRSGYLIDQVLANFAFRFIPT